MENEKKPTRRRLRPWLGRVTLCLGTAVIVSSAYLVYMFQWTTHRMDLEAAHRSLQQDFLAMEGAFRRHVDRTDDFTRTTGYDSDEEIEEFHIENVMGDMRKELAFINKSLSSPLPPEKLNLRNVLYALGAEKRDALKAVSLSREELQTVKKQHEYEIKDLNMQALIYLHRIDRLERRLAELEERK